MRGERGRREEWTIGSLNPGGGAPKTLPTPFTSRLPSDSSRTGCEVVSEVPDDGLLEPRRCEFHLLHFHDLVALPEHGGFPEINLRK